MTDEQTERMEKLCDAYRMGDKSEFDVKLDKLRIEIKANKELSEERERASDKALKLATDILDKRMIAENNIREEMRDRTTSFLTRIEYDGKHEGLISKIDSLAEKTNTMSGKMMLIIIGIPIFISVVISVVSMFIFHMASK